MAGHTLEELARAVKGTPSEKPGPNILGVRPLEFARSSDISYVAGPANLKGLANSEACAVFLPFGLETDGRPCIWVNNPEAAFAKVTGFFYRPPRPDGEISSHAYIHPEAVLAHNVSVGHFAVIERGAVIGSDSFIGSHAVIGEGVSIGENARVHPHVTIYPGVKIGARVTIHAGTVVGSDGFGYARDLDDHGAPVNVKKYHSGTVEIEDDVEIGALWGRDRARGGVGRV
jgi:UDP-3-O-[3-hydroxymyristoyl] glucosamine N-acyltransferase